MKILKIQKHLIAETKRAGRRKKSRKGEVEVVYNGPESLNKEAEEHLNRAFGILFDEMLR